MTIELTGDKALLASFDADMRIVASEARKAVGVAAAGCERDAKTFAPVDTGTLRNSISTSLSGNATFSRAEIGPTVNYGQFVEEGTSRMAPQAFVGPAFDRNTPPFISAMEAIAGKLQ